MKTDRKFMKALPLIVAVAALIYSAYGQQQKMNNLEEVVATAPAQPEQPATRPYVNDRVIHLPEDGGSYHTTILTHTNWEGVSRDRELVAWFTSDPRLASLRAQTHFHHYTDSNPLYRTRLAAAVPQQELPAVMIQSADGAVLCKFSGNTLPGDPMSLGDMLSDCFPRPAPPPAPGPQPLPPPNTPYIPDTRPTPPPGGPGGNDPGIMVAIIALIIGGVAALADSIKDKISKVS